MVFGHKVTFHHSLKLAKPKELRIKFWAFGKGCPHRRLSQSDYSLPWPPTPGWIWQCGRPSSLLGLCCGQIVDKDLQPLSFSIQTALGPWALNKEDWQGLVSSAMLLEICNCRWWKLRHQHLHLNNAFDKYCVNSNAT